MRLLVHIDTNDKLYRYYFSVIKDNYMEIIIRDLLSHISTQAGEYAKTMHPETVKMFVNYHAAGIIQIMRQWMDYKGQKPCSREVYAKDVKANDEEDSQDGNTGGDAGNGANKKENVEERTLPSFVKGESGDHTPTLTEKWTTPPKYYTEATLLRAMETAGKFVEDEELRAALKENGIGRPSSRAGIIETLFKRHYIRRQRKNLMATPTGIELIDTIHEELLKSCELTGIWEKKLRDIEHKTYDPGQFINELKEQINQIVNDVLADNSSRITTTTEEDLKKKETKKKKTAPKPKKLPADDSIIGKVCPVCGQGTIIKGKTAYGCSNWKGGCKFRLPFAE